MTSLNSRHASMTQFVHSISSIALFLTVALLCSASTLRAQSYPVPYNFNPAQQGSIDSGETKILSMAANGYGQWVVTSQEWRLLGNGAHPLDETDPGRVIPTGEVARGTLLDPSFAEGLRHSRYCKVATNLGGSVRFVRPNATNYIDATGFIVQGFDSPDIALSFPNFPKPKINRSPIRTHCRAYSHELLSPYGTPGLGIIEESENIDNVGVEDYYDVAMDAKYLYVCWCGENPTTGTTTVWAVAYSLSTGTLAFGPSAVMQGLHRPTIACDVRNSPQGPTFDVCALDPTHIFVTTCFNGTIYNPQSLADPYSVPIRLRVDFSPTPVGTGCIPNPPLYYAEPSVGPIGNVRHARILVSSVPSADPTQPHKTSKAVYILATEPDAGWDEALIDRMRRCELLFQRIDWDPTTAIDPNHPQIIEPAAHYVEGPLMHSHPAPIQDYRANNQITITDGPIHAFANPYDEKTVDGEASSPEFHCIYELPVRKPSSLVGSAWYYYTALCIVRCDQNGCWGPDTRHVVNSTETSAGSDWLFPASNANNALLYGAAAVNQMGIHVRWAEERDGYKYYRRDQRYFDEPMEENTLVTYDCSIKDGTSHGGTVGMDIPPGLTMALWTDPYVGISTTGTATGLVLSNQTQGLHWHNAQLTLDPSVTTWTIAGSYSRNARLVMLPNTLLHLQETGTQAVSFGAYSELHYFGKPNPNTFLESSTGEQIPFTSFLGRGTLEFAGGVVGNDAGLPVASEVYVHGGSTMEIPEKYSMYFWHSNFHLLFEPALLPIWGADMPNQDSVGTLVIHGQTDMLSTNPPKVRFLSNMKSGKTLPAIIVRPCLNRGGSDCAAVTTQFSPSQVDFINSGDGFPYVAYNGTIRATSSTPLVTYRPITIDSCLFQGWGVDVSHPANTVLVLNSSFDSIGGNAIYLHRPADGAAYSQNHINGNSFANFRHDSYTIHPRSKALVIEGFSNPLLLNNLEVEANDITLDSWDPNSVAIQADNSQALILANHLTLGIGVTGISVQGVSTQKSQSLICGNYITGPGLFPTSGGFAGLRTSHWQGYAKKNYIEFQDTGHVVGIGDVGHVIFSNYSFNLHLGIDATSGGSVDLSGVHNVTEDYPAFDTIRNNGWFTSGNFIRAQIAVSSGPSQFLFLGANCTPDLSGRNSVISSDQSQPLILSSSTTPVELGDISQNHWWRSGLVQPTGTSNTYIGNCSYRANPTFDLVPAHADGPIFCSAGSFLKASSASLLSPPILDSCSGWFEFGRNNATDGNTASLAYDTLKHFLLSCYDNPNACVAFDYLSAAEQNQLNPEILIPFREFLKSVLFLNTSECYFCHAMQSILGTFGGYGVPQDYNAQAAVIDYILESNKCPEMASSYSSQRKMARLLEWHAYQDTVEDQTLTPFDTTKPSLESLGLGLLLEHSSVHPAPRYTYDIVSLRVLENPFHTVTEIEFELGEYAVVQVEVFDVLGHQVYASGRQEMEHGLHRLSIAPDGESTGTLYLRLSTALGEVRTLKLTRTK